MMRRLSLIEDELVGLGFREDEVAALTYLALQLKARMEGLETPVYELQQSHHAR